LEFENENELDLSFFAVLFLVLLAQDLTFLSLFFLSSFSLQLLLLLDMDAEYV